MTSLLSVSVSEECDLGRMTETFWGHLMHTERLVAGIVNPKEELFASEAANLFVEPVVEFDKTLAALKAVGTDLSGLDNMKQQIRRLLQEKTYLLACKSPLETGRDEKKLLQRWLDISLT